MSAEVRRWRRYGHDRAYVLGSDGTKLGYRDLKAQRDHIDVPERRDEFLLALAGVVPSPRCESEAQDPAQAAHPEHLVVPPPATVPAEEPWAVVRHAIVEDLTLRRAGQEARQQARELQRAAPVRVLLARMLGERNDERAWRLGAKGESLVARELARLLKQDPRWHVLHAVPVGDRGADIDHVLVGPAGVMTLNAKHHPNASLWIGGDVFLVNNHRQPYVRNSRHEARRAGRLLSAATGSTVQARGVVVPVNAARVTIKALPDDVMVVPRLQLVGWLRGLAQVLDEVTIKHIFEAARRSSTWSTGQA